MATFVADQNGTPGNGKIPPNAVSAGSKIDNTAIVANASEGKFRVCSAEHFSLNFSPLGTTGDDLKAVDTSASLDDQEEGAPKQAAISEVVFKTFSIFSEGGRRITKT